MDIPTVFPLQIWHFEISSKCTLHCPRCPRQEFKEGLKNTELNLEFFKNTFTPLFVHSHIEKILFCGNDGDPIYAHDLIDVVSYFKKIKPRIGITIVTNGSYKTSDWWQKLGAVLKENDKVLFSIDGYDNESNRKYRINSDWDSIMSGINTLRSNSECQIIWAAIPFSFNENHLDMMRDMAQGLGMDQFQLTYSSKFDGTYLQDGQDPLKPSEHFTSNARYTQSVTDFTKRSVLNPALSRMPAVVTKIPNGISPACRLGTGHGLYINASGLFYPCCWIGTRYPQNAEFHTIAEDFNLHNRTLADVLSDAIWTQDSTYQWHECQHKCTA